MDWIIAKNEKEMHSGELSETHEKSVKINVFESTGKGKFKLSKKKDFHDFLISEIFI